MCRRLAHGLGGEPADLYVVESRDMPPRGAYLLRSGRRHLPNRPASGIRRPGFAMVMSETDAAANLTGGAFGCLVRGARPSREGLLTDHSVPLGATMTRWPG